MKIVVKDLTSKTVKQELGKFNNGLYIIEDKGSMWNGATVLVGGEEHCKVMVNLNKPASFWTGETGCWTLRKLTPEETVTLSND